MRLTYILSIYYFAFRSFLLYNCTLLKIACSIIVPDSEYLPLSSCA